jgi:Na+-translocating ferredoxin:NAD+ oxidoreductase RnfG subunit
MKIAVVGAIIALVFGSFMLGMNVGLVVKNQETEQLQRTLNQILIESKEIQYQLQKYVIGNQNSSTGAVAPMAYPEFSNRDLLIEIYNQRGGK